MIAYIGLAIGIIVGAFGIISGLKEKKDAEQKRIFLIAGAIGVIVAIVSAIAAF